MRVRAAGCTRPRNQASLPLCLGPPGLRRTANPDDFRKLGLALVAAAIPLGLEPVPARPSTPLPPARLGGSGHCGSSPSRS
eukprot:7518503-Alexandrium_andersonii.AAC.1